MTNEPCITEIRGQCFQSQGAASRHFGVCKQTVQSAIDRGCADGIGLGRNHWSEKSVALDGLKYQSIASLAVAKCTPITTVRSWVLRAKKRGAKSVKTRIGVVSWA